ncbi:NADPH dehydrogenase 3 [Monosporozyma servazzii]
MTFSKDFTPMAFNDTNMVKPIKVGNLTLSHRVVMAPLARERSRAKNIINGDLASIYYGQRAQAPGTLLISEATFFSPQASGFDRYSGIWLDEQIEEWKKIFATVHEKKSYMFVQLLNLGKQADPEHMARNGLRYDAASEDLYVNEEIKQKALAAGIKQHGITKDEIKQYIKEYVEASKKIIAAGADGVEILSGNGYLLHEFINASSNNRTDEYGGSIENRGRFTLEVIDALIDAIGAEKVSVRFSPFFNGTGMLGAEEPEWLEMYSYLLDQLEKRAKSGKRLAYVHFVEPRITRGWWEGEQATNPDHNNDFVFDHWTGPVVKAGNFAGLPKLTRDALKNDRTLIAYGRYFIANPDLVHRLVEGLPLNKYDRSTFYSCEAKGYTDYPTYDEAVKKGWK